MAWREPFRHAPPITFARFSSDGRQLLTISVNGDSHLWTIRTGQEMLRNPEADSREYAVKTAFLYHFFQFTTWPSNAFAKADSPFQVGLLGDTLFGDSFELLDLGLVLNY